MSAVIEIDHVSKRYGDKLALDDVSFTVRPGVVTGFLGPNGAGKLTAMRLILGLDRPTAGTARINGTAYRDFAAPLHQVGAMLETRTVHPGRSARGHLLSLAQTHGIGRSRVDALLERVGLEKVAHTRVGSFSLGMGQRLGIAAALLGDPHALILDEPGNGLDPEGILWIRGLMRGLAAEGRTVFVSSHLMSEMAQIADRLIVIGRGRLIADTTIEAFTHRASSGRVRVRSPRVEALEVVLVTHGATVTPTDHDVLEVRGLDAARIGELAAGAGIALHELTPREPSLEEAFMRMTGTEVDYSTSEDLAAAAA